MLNSFCSILPTAALRYSIVCHMQTKEKCGAYFVYLYEGCGKTQVTINDTIPHTWIGMRYAYKPRMIISIQE